MTGFGEARHQTDALSVGVEVRAVNNRYLKVTVRGTDPYRMLEAALKNLDAMRRDEGRAMAAELLVQHRHITGQLDAIRQQLPGVMAEYRQRLIDRIRQALKDTAVAVELDHLVREVALFAD